MILVRFIFTRCHVNEVSMSFSIRPYRRFPLCCPVTYHAGLHEGHGTVWNLSLTGWRLSGDLPLRIGQSLPMTVTLLDQERVFVAAVPRRVRPCAAGVCNRRHRGYSWPIRRVS